MTLFELLKLHNLNHLREDLGDNWIYEELEHGFLIHYQNMLGGIKVIVKSQPYFDDELFVYRIFNSHEEEIYSEYYDKEYDVDLSALHFGVSEKLKHTFGY